MALEFTDDNFAKEVLQSDKPVLVDFWAPWCGPCKMIGPIVEKLANELSATVKIGKLNVDDNQATAGEYNVMSIPTLLLFKNGKVVGTTMGFTPEPRLRDFIAQAGAAKAG
jgi:thioredoxin 1